MSVLPAELSPLWTGSLVTLSFFTSAFTAAFGVGGGVALLAVMLTILPPAIVLPLHGIVQFGSNAGRAFVMRAHVNRPILRWFALGSVLGVSGASLIVVSLPTPWMQVILGVFILWSLWWPKPSFEAPPARGYFWVGLIASFCTMFVGATGVLVGSFWRVAQLGKEGVVGTHAAAMMLQHGFKVVAFGVLGFVFSKWLGFIAMMVGAGYLGTLAGKRLLGRLPERVFAMAFKVILTVFALDLVRRAISGFGLT